MAGILNKKQIRNIFYKHTGGGKIKVNKQAVAELGQTQVKLEVVNDVAVKVRI